MAEELGTKRKTRAETLCESKRRKAVMPPVQLLPGTSSSMDSETSSHATIQSSKAQKTITKGVVSSKRKKLSDSREQVEPNGKATNTAAATRKSTMDHSTAIDQSGHKKKRKSITKAMK